MSTKSRFIAATTVDVNVPVLGGRVGVRLLGALLFAGLTFVGANISIPLYPVPITLQTLFVLLAGAVLGARFGALSQFFYVAFGVAGIPVFSGGAAGWAVITGHTGGYLLGFIVAPLLVGCLVRRHGAIWWQALVFYAGSLTILGLGVAYLRLFFANSLLQALEFGYFPFIVGDVVKIVAALSIYRSYSAIRRGGRAR